MFKLNDFEDGLTTERLLSCIPGDSADLYEDDAEDILEEIRKADAMHPGAVYQPVEVTGKEGNTLLFGDTKITSSLFERYIQKGDRVYACLVTVGEALDRFAAGLDDPMLSYLQGILMNICLDDGLLWAAKAMSEEKPGKRILMVKPGVAGVCEFSEQMGILSLLDGAAEELGVEVKANGFLNPGYSSTALLFTSDEESNASIDWADEKEKRDLLHDLNVIAGHV